VSDWQARLLDRVAAQGKDHSSQAEFRLRARPRYFELIDCAALARGVSRSVYMRRMIALGLANDLNLDVREVLHLTAHWRNALHDKTDAPRDDRGVLLATSDDGFGITDWCPHPGCNGAHLLTQQKG
jgi:hypothetical protein